MQFPPLQRHRPTRDPVLPMINVVFLLLIFFLMSAQITPAPPFDLTPPEALAEPEETLPEAVLWVSAEGGLDHAGLSGEAALAALEPGAPVLLRADAALDAATLAALLGELSARGLGEIRLATEPRGAP